MRRNMDVEWHFQDRLQEAMADNMVEESDFETYDICSASSIRSYLNGTQIPNLRTAHAIAQFLNVSVDYLCGED